MLYVRSSLHYHLASFRLIIPYARIHWQQRQSLLLLCKYVMRFRNALVIDFTAREIAARVVQVLLTLMHGLYLLKILLAPLVERWNLAFQI